MILLNLQELQLDCLLGLLRVCKCFKAFSFLGLCPLSLDPTRGCALDTRYQLPAWVNWWWLHLFANYQCHIWSWHIDSKFLDLSVCKCFKAFSFRGTPDRICPWTLLGILP